MNEREWVACEDPDQMLRFLQHSGKLSERKARLFACAAVRRVWHLLTDERSQRAVEVAERYTDGEASRKELLTAAEQAYVAVRLAEKVGDANIRAAKMATAYAGVWTMRWLPYRLLEPPVPGKTLSDWPFAGVCLCDLLRDIFGLLPFRSRPTISPSVRAWNDGTVIRLAQAAYQERELPSGHFDSLRLKVLADALEEAGCSDQDILGHLRGAGPHTRGCWCVDLLLEKS